MFRLFTPLFAEIDRITIIFARDVSGRVIAGITPVISVGLTLSFICWALLIMRGVVQQPILEFVGRVVRTALIVSVALGTGLYQSRIAELVRTIPDDLAAVVIGSEELRLYTLDGARATLGGEGYESAQGALIDRMADLGVKRSSEAFEKSGIFTQQGIAFGCFGVLLLMATLVMVCVGGSMIMVAKVVLALLAGLGPLFIAALLFDATKRFFERWVAMVATYGLVAVLCACVFSFMLGIFGNYMARVEFDGDMNVTYAVGGAVALTMVSVLLLRELVMLAMGLGGGMSVRRNWYAPAARLARRGGANVTKWLEERSG